MPVLENPRHELFARGLARGMTQSEAYEFAGFSPSLSNANFLARKAPIKARISEIIMERESKIEGAADWGKIENATNRDDLGLDQTWVLRELMLTVKFARETNNAGAAVKALELLGRELGLTFGSGGSANRVPATSTPQQPVNVNVLVDFADKLNNLNAGDGAVDVTPHNKVKVRERPYVKKPRLSLAEKEGAIDVEP